MRSISTYLSSLSLLVALGGSSVASAQFCDAEVSAISPDLQSQFGSTVDVSFTGDTFVVGSPFGDIGAGCPAGTATIYTLDPGSGSWLAVQELTTASGECDDQFGYDVSIFSDTLVVGAPFEDVAGVPDAGRVYVYRRAATGVWTLSQILAEVTPFAGARYGHSVSVQDGRIAVGAIRSGFFGPSAGAAYVYRNIGGAYIFEDRLAPDPAAPGAFFGTSVSLMGQTCVVGAVYDDSAANDAGAAYMFRRQPNTTWEQEAKFTPPNASANDFFGIAVGVWGSLAIVGAEGYDAGAPDSGAAFCYIRSATGTWSLEQQLSPSSPSPTGTFGRAVSIDEMRAAVTDFSGSAGGVAALFERMGPGGWSNTRNLDLGGAGNSGAFGTEVSIRGGVLVVGAPLRSTSVPFSGSAFVYDLDFEDCNQNALNDVCELAQNGSFLDCDGNGVIDSCQIALDPSSDCNINGVLDSCEIASFPGLDCDGDGTIDSCQLAADPSLDCNFNLVLDACDIASGLEVDVNGNLIPDQCEPVGTPAGCQTLANSTGAVSQLRAIGSGVAINNDLVLVGSQLPPNVFGFPLVSLSSGANVPPGAVGFLCLGGTIGRHLDLIFNTGPGGEALVLIDLLNIPQGSFITSADAGETWRWQLWHRDEFGGQGTSTFTDAIAIDFQ